MSRTTSLDSWSGSSPSRCRPRRCPRRPGAWVGRRGRAGRAAGRRCARRSTGCPAETGDDVGRVRRGVEPVGGPRESGPYGQRRMRPEAGQDRERRVRADERRGDDHGPGLAVGEPLGAWQQLQDERARVGEGAGLLGRTGRDERGGVPAPRPRGRGGRVPWRVPARPGREVVYAYPPFRTSPRRIGSSRPGGWPGPRGGRGRPPSG